MGNMYDRQADCSLGAGVRQIADRDAAARPFADRLRDCQSEAGAAAGAGAGSIAAIERLEEIRQIRGRHSLALILHRHRDLVAAHFDRRLDNRIGRAVLQGVQQEVGAEQGAISFIDPHGWIRAGPQLNSYPF